MRYLCIILLFVSILATAQESSAPAPQGVKRIFLGFKLTRIDHDSLYEKVGLREGDLLKALDGHVVNSAKDLERLPDLLHRNKHVTLKVVRGGKTMILKYRLVLRKRH